MGEKMTLEQVRSWLHQANVENYPLATSMCGALADAIEAHLATPAQTVDAEFEVTG